MNDTDPKDSKYSVPSGWIVIHTTSDMWEAKLLRTAMLAERIRCEIMFRKKDQIEILVPEDREEEAEFIISRAVIAISEQNQPVQPAQPVADKIESSFPQTKSTPLKTEQAQPDEPRIPHSSPTATQRAIIAQRQGIGEIVHFESRGYELRVGPEPYYLVAEARWEEFTDFSAQRQEFAILLKGEYPRLFKWLKAEKQMAEFIKLVESTYRDVPPPKPKKSKVKPIARQLENNQSNENNENNENKVQSKKTCWLANICISFALVGVAALVFEFHLYLKYASSILALSFGLIAKYQIIQQGERLQGNRLAAIGIIISSIVLAITLAQR